MISYANSVSLRFINKMMKSLLLISLICLPLTAWAQKDILTADGPYIVYDSLGTGATITQVTTEGKVVQQHVSSLASDYTFKVTTSDGNHTFDVKLHHVQQPAWDNAMPNKLFVTSDPHANFDCFFDLLHANGIINDQCDWTFGNGHLALVGDIMDRGDDATAIYWLLYKLEAQAAAEGGAVHFMMGNHEPLVLMNDNRYTRPKYTMLADTLGVKYNHFFSQRSELGRWIITRNTIERIGRNILVHAGLSRTLYDSGLTIPEINSLMPLGLYKRKSERKASGETTYMLHGSDGPIWYRGLVRNDAKYNPIASDTLNMILDRFDAERIIVGHTIFDDISSFHEGRVIGVNVDNAENRKENRSRALLIEDGVLWIIGNDGRKIKTL